MLAACSPAQEALESALAAGLPAPEPVDGRVIIADIGRINTPNGVEEFFAAKIGGIDQWLTIRGKDRHNPVIILVHGGPGSAELSIGWTSQRGWEDCFTALQWDQRGAGKTYAINDPYTSIPTLSADRMTADMIEVVDFVRERPGKERVILLRGRHDLTTPPSVSAAWLARLEAPARANYWFEHSAHLALIEGPRKVLMMLVTCIRTYATQATPEAAKAAAAGCINQ